MDSVLTILYPFVHIITNGSWSIVVPAIPCFQTLEAELHSACIFKSARRTATGPRLMHAAQMAGIPRIMTDFYEGWPLYATRAAGFLFPYPFHLQLGLVGRFKCRVVNLLKDNF